MSGTEYWLPLIWSAIAAVAILTYVLLDGFDLGIGMLFAFQKDPKHRDTMLNSIAPVWDGNETWMVMGGATLFGVFPLAYGLILSALYPLIIALVLALIFRGVAFEFRFKVSSPHARKLWSYAFMWGSLIATICQGLVLGTLIQGLPILHEKYVGSMWIWLNPFSLFCAFSLVVGYTLLGSTWLIMKTEGELKEHHNKIAYSLSALFLLCILGVSIWTPFLFSHYMRNWLEWPKIIWVAPVPVLVILLAYLLWYGLKKRHDHLPFLSVNLLFFLNFSGLGITIWPYIIPPYLTIWQASSPAYSQGFLLVGVAILLPLILGYTLYSYWVFRGKVSGGYH